MARYKRTPKTIYISDDDDCFDADYDTQEEEQKEQREEENQGDKEQGKDKFPVEMLKPGTLIIIRDEHSRKGSQAFIINPGVSNNGMQCVFFLFCRCIFFEYHSHHLSK